MAKHPAYDAVIVGLGQSGLACARHLLAAGRQVAVMDTREAPPGLSALRELDMDVPVHTGGLDEQLLANAAEIVLSPGVDPRQPVLREARRRGQRIVGEIELFAQSVAAPVVAITGSNGKSTVTTMVGEMAKSAGKNVAVGGNLGPPALDLLAMQPNADLFVLELSSFQLETTLSLQPAVAAVLNLSADHLDRYNSVRDYASAKARILQQAEHAVLNIEDLAVAAMATVGLAVTWFGEGAGEYRLLSRADGQWLARGEIPLLPISALPLSGRHNQHNALAALAIGSTMGWSDAAMVEALSAFRGLPHRSEVLGWYADRLWINDSKATNVGAAVAGLQGLSQPLVLLAGGDGKAQDFAAFADGLPADTRAAVVYGAAAGELAQALGSKVAVQQVQSLADAVSAARHVSQPGDVVVLAPACASFDQFANYQERGQQFAALVTGVSQHG